jgi:hypothetical protein
MCGGFLDSDWFDAFGSDKYALTFTFGKFVANRKISEMRNVPLELYKLVAMYVCVN